MDCTNKEITGSVQIKNGVYYLSINFYSEGRRKPQMFNTKLEVKGYNKRKADEMLRQKLHEVNARPEDEILTTTETSPPPMQVIHARAVQKAYPGDSILVHHYFSRWIERMKSTVRPNTWIQYNRNVQMRIIPYFSEFSLTLTEVEPHHIQAFFDYCHKKGRLDGKPGEISSSTMRRIHANLSKAFMDALRLQEIPSSPMMGINPPKNNVYHANYYTAEQMNIFLGAIKDNRVEIPLLLCAFYGVRRSEAIGLKWDAVDFEAKMLTIRHTVTSGEKSGLLKDNTTKNKSSYRSLPLLPEVECALKKARVHQEEQKQFFGNSYNLENYICIGEDGQLIHPNRVTKEYMAICKRADLPKTRLHDLRHTNASLLVKNSCNLKEIQRWLGHSDIKTTGNLYSHLDTNDLVHVGGVIQSKLCYGV